MPRATPLVRRRKRVHPAAVVDKCRANARACDLDAVTLLKKAVGLARKGDLLAIKAAAAAIACMGAAAGHRDAASDVLEIK